MTDQRKTSVTESPDSAQEKSESGSGSESQSPEKTPGQSSQSAISGWLARFKAARRVGTPLASIESADQLETAKLIAASTNDAVIWWDCASGPRPLNVPARVVVKKFFPDSFQSLNLIEALKSAEQIPEGSILLLALAHRFIDEAAVIQAVANLRDPWKSSGSTLVLLVPPATKLPSELSQDVLTIDRPLPTPEELLPVVEGLAAAASEQLGKELPSKEVLVRAAEALVGLSEFAAESACALAVDDGGLVPETLWERKRALVNQTPGLQLVPPGSETFEKVGGMEAIRTFGDRLFKSKNPPRLIVWIDELEKALAGVGAATGGIGDSSGTSQDQLGVLLRYQEEQGWGGVLLVGPPGSGKSMVAKALGASHRIPTVMLDLGALKGSLVGQSEQRVRAAMRIIQALAGKQAFFVATCNRLESVPPELRRRYKKGIWFADLPTQAERAQIWQIHLGAFGLPATGAAVKKLSEYEWTGAEIRNCCELASDMEISPGEASNYIIPISQSDPEMVDRLRRAADGRWLSVSEPGAYKIADKSTPGGGTYAASSPRPQLRPRRNGQ